MLRTSALIIVLTTTIEIMTGSMDVESVPASVTAAIPADDRDHHVGADASSAAAATPEPPATGSLREDEQALVDWALGRFAEAGLELPDITVRFDPSRHICGNAEGRYRNEGGAHLVTICTRDSDSFAAQLERRRTLLHEFGHVWDTVNLNDRDRVRLGEILGTAHWYDDDSVWAARGVERFAETFVFALLDQPARQLKIAADCKTLVGALSAATSSTPLGPGLPACAD